MAWMNIPDAKMHDSQSCNSDGVADGLLPLHTTIKYNGQTRKIFAVSVP
jgi:hypothetical protein